MSNTSPVSYYVYGLCEAGTATVKYIGVTINPTRRLKAHLSDKTGCQKSIWVNECIRRGAKPYMSILCVCDTPELAAGEEKRLYAFHGGSVLIGGDPNVFVYKRGTSRAEREQKSESGNEGSALFILQTNPLLNLKSVASMMWPQNNNAKSYLSKKLSGKLPFTDADEILARKVLTQIGRELLSIVP